jgi:hypothetical protein
VADGDFKLDHLRNKRPMDDVWLRDGEGYMVEEKPYYEHIKVSVESTQVYTLLFLQLLPQNLIGSTT